jgi:peptidoglycan/LPS O-acetylase OafA/YrhL
VRIIEFVWIIIVPPTYDPDSTDESPLTEREDEWLGRLQCLKPKEKARGRLLIIDVTRISGIALVLLHHMIGTELMPSWIHHFNIDLLPYLWYINYGSIGAWLFVFASGCSLATSNSEFSSLSEVTSFYKKRFIRIYPAYWVSLLFSMFILSWVMSSLTITDLIKWFSGFQVYLTTYYTQQGKINITYWFIGLILSLYLLYPLLLYAIKKHPNISLISFFFISLASRWILYYIFPTFSGGWDAFPLCRFFNFGLGIYLIRKGWFPKAISNRTIAFLGVMSFYVFLLEYPIICVTNFYGGIFYFVLGMIVFSFLLYLLDNFIKNLRFKRSVTEKNSMQATT